MGSKQFEFESELPVSAAEAYAWHTRPGALARLSPPWERVRVLSEKGDLAEGTVALAVPAGPFHLRWVARHRDAVEGRQFVDEQIEGPFTRWVHTHLFEPQGATSCRYIDRIEYRLPLGIAGEIGAGWVSRELERTFRYRHATVEADLTAHKRHARRGALTILVTGSSGFIGQTLIPFLTTGGHRVRRLVRSQPGPDDILWNPNAGQLDGSLLEGVDAVVHLAGEPIAAGRWTTERRRRILESRTLGTLLLCETLAGLRLPPAVMVSASAVGIYGDRGNEGLTESTPINTGPDARFVEQVGQAWEAATAPAGRAGIRVASIRIGLVLSPAGGALARMLPPFRAGVGGRLGSGAQYMSWLSIDDLVGAIHHCLMTDSLQGPVNAVAPDPATNAEFTHVLGEVLGRPTLFPVPATALRLLFGQMANDLLLASTRVLPERLEATQYPFRHPGLRQALRHVLGR
jgi:uncharacterized protein